MLGTFTIKTVIVIKTTQIIAKKKKLQRIMSLFVQKLEEKKNKQRKRSNGQKST